ncbi:hypothetical protein CPB83DRAFT_889102 [Crepidotus variabilis]|uniref:Lysine-specific metallo-endopeptidase domain-containing protein n=1 Tax=Crepidotus variabilis TaxID=179855 RepID=A0A9P6EUQ4_9AGAR|nr:hypothetical protein CPB83DRAFT_889102 [Crepidotus variabilis]
MKFFNVVLPFLLAIPLAVASPIPLTYKVEANFDKMKHTFIESLKTILDEEYIPAMMSALDHPTNPKADTALKLAFGRDYKTEIPTIKANVEKFKNYEATIGQITEPFYDVAGYHPEKKEIWLTSEFFKFHGGKEPKTPQDFKALAREAAPTMIHELSHAAFGTVDLFQRSDFKPTTAAAKKASPHDDGYYKGFEDLQKHYKQIRAHGAATQVQSAEAYLVFAHVSLLGDVDLTPFMPRALWAL